MLESEHYLGPHEGDYGGVVIVITREEELTPKMTVHVLAEGVFQDCLSEMAAKVATLGEQTGGTTSGHLLLRKQRVITGTEGHLLGGAYAPGGAKAMEVALLAYPRLVRIHVEPDLAPARPAAPQHVEHFVVLGIGIVAGEELVRKAELIVISVVEQVTELGVTRVGVQVAETGGLGRWG